MRIGFVVYGDINTLTGGYLYDSILVERLRRRGHAVTVVSLAVKGYFGRLVDNVSTASRELISDCHCDLLLQDELCHPSLFALNSRLRRDLKIPVVTVVHQVFCDEPRHASMNRFFAMVEKRYLDSVDGFVFNSRTTLDTVVRLSRRSRPHIIAPPGGDRLDRGITPAEIRKRTLRSGPLQLLFLGNVIPRKGLLPLIDGLADISRHQWRLDVVGSLSMDARYVKSVQKRIRHHGIDSAVCFCGVMTGSALAEKIANTHLLCMPYSYEGFGIVALEAQAMGVPVIGSTEGATPELIQNGTNGYLVDRDHPAALKAAIQEFYADPEKRVQMSEAAFRHFQQHPTWAESMDRIAVFLEAMADVPVLV